MTASKAIILILLLGCDVDVEPGFAYELSGGAQVSPGASPTASGDLDADARTFEHAAAGYLVLDDSPIEPWCGGVLVAPDVVMTSSACVEGYGTSRVAVGFSLPNDGSLHDVDETVVLDADPRLAALLLASPVQELAPAPVGVLARSRCDVNSVSYRYVAGDDVSDRWIWTGCFEPETAALVPDDGGPNCHGDTGAPAFSRRDELVGIVVGASGGAPCVDRVVLAVPSDGGAFAEALALSDAPAG